MARHRDGITAVFRTPVCQCLCVCILYLAWLFRAGCSSGPFGHKIWAWVERGLDASDRVGYIALELNRKFNEALTDHHQKSNEALADHLAHTKEHAVALSAQQEKNNSFQSEQLDKFFSALTARPNEEQRLTIEFIQRQLLTQAKNDSTSFALFVLYGQYVVVCSCL